MRVSDFDVCECGDYRGQHDDEWRACRICQPDDGMNGRECLMFRPFQRAVIKWKAA